jgi:hypothetical protein
MSRRFDNALTGQRTRRGRVGRALLIVAGCLCVPAAARAQSDVVERAKASFKAGATAYAAGEYLAAIQALGAAYTLTPVPAIAFSLAQAERRQYFVGHDREHLERAVTLFRRYVEQVPSGGRRADALDALSQLEPLLAAAPSGAVTRAELEGDAIRRTRLMVTSDAPGASIAIDGGPAGPSPLIREVTPGKHRVEVSAEGFYPEDRELSAIAGELIPEVVTLRERPASLAITAPRGAEIYVDGAYVGHGGDQVVLTLPSGQHRLTVAENGYRVAFRAFELERGKVQAFRIDLEATPQRKAANVLFITGAGALAAGAVFGAIAFHAESNAQDFLARKAERNVSASALAEYDDNVATRGRFRVATGISLASAAGLFITGFFLRQFDRPASEDIHRPSAEAGRKTSPSEARSIGVAPVLQPSGVGAILQGTF